MNFIIKSFFIVSIVLFSFAPWMAINSIFTRFTSYILYLLFFALLASALLLGKFNKRKVINCLFLILLLLIFILIGFFQVGSSAVISQFVNLFIPAFLVMIFYSIKNISLTKKDIWEIFLVLFICCFINCVYSIYSVSSFTGDFSKLYIDKLEKYPEYNFIRNGRLRAFGLLTSAVILSNYLSVILIYLLFNIKTKKYFGIRLLFVFLVIFTLYLTGSRTPFFAIFVSLFLFLFFNKKRKLLFFASILSIIFLLLIVFLTSGLDLSAQGRILQYVNALDLILKNPLGYGFGYAGFPKGVVSFDCAILVIPVNFGLIPFFLTLFIYYKSISKPIKNHNKYKYIQDWLIIFIFISSGFANVIHLGILTITIIIYYLSLQSDKSCQLKKSL